MENKEKTFFESLQEDKQKRKNLKLYKQQEKRNRKNAESDSQQKLRDLMRLATEFQTLFKAKPFRCFIEFIDILERDLNAELRSIPLRTKDYREMALKSAKVAAKLELIVELRDRPRSIVKKLEEEKEQ